VSASEALDEADEDEEGVDNLARGDAPASNPLPQPPHAPLFLHVTARVCGLDEFVQAYSPQHLSSFYHPMSSARQRLGSAGSGASRDSGAGSGREGRRGAGAGDDAAATLTRVGPAGLPAVADAVRGVLTSLLSDVVSDVDLTNVLGPLTALTDSASVAAASAALGIDGGRGANLVPRSVVAGDAAAEDPVGAAARRLATASELVGGVTFAEVVEVRGDNAALATRISERMAQRTAEAFLASAAVRKATAGVFDDGVPQLLPGEPGFTVLDDADSLRALVDGECRDFSTRYVESVLLALMRDAVAGDADLLKAEAQAAPRLARGASAARIEHSPSSNVDQPGRRPASGDEPRYKRIDELDEE
jgi:hypothetical protein